MMPSEIVKSQPNLAIKQPLARHASLSKISRRLLVETYAPAAVLINRDFRILFSLGPVGQYLNLPTGHTIQDLPALVPADLRGRLRTAMQSVFRDNLPVSLAGNMQEEGPPLSYRIDVLPVPDKAEPLQLVCFLAGPAAAASSVGGDPAAPAGAANLQQQRRLEQQLQSARAALEGALQEVAIANAEHRAINEEAITASQESQVTIEELLSWKSALESLANETNALNGQLRGALEMQQTNANILRNILHSIGVAVLLLDPELHIRFFTPEIEPFFHLITSDIGRPLGDLHYLAADHLLESDCLDVLRTTRPIGREIELPDGKQFLRNIVPYRCENDEIEGVIVTFSEVTETGAILAAPSARPQRPQIPPVPPADSANMPPEAGEKLQQVIDQTAGKLAVMLNSLREIRQIDQIGHPNADDLPEKASEQREDAVRRIANLTPRERQIMQIVVAGHPSKSIALELGISQRTVENHRAAIMRKTESKSLPILARVAFASGLSKIIEPSPER